MFALRLLLAAALFVPALYDGIGVDPMGSGLWDPNGAYSDEGSGICPNGRPFRVTADEGNGFDPHGTPRTSSSTDQGSAIDPNGGYTGGTMDPNGGR